MPVFRQEKSFINPFFELRPFYDVAAHDLKLTLELKEGLGMSTGARKSEKRISFSSSWERVTCRRVSFHYIVYKFACSIVCSDLLNYVHLDKFLLTDLFLLTGNGLRYSRVLQDSLTRRS